MPRRTKLIDCLPTICPGILTITFNNGVSSYQKPVYDFCKTGPDCAFTSSGNRNGFGAGSPSNESAAQTERSVTPYTLSIARMNMVAPPARLRFQSDRRGYRRAGCFQ